GVYPIDQFNPQIAADADGDFVVVWGKDEGDGAFARRYDAAGNPRGAAFQVGSFAEARNPVVAMDADGDFVIAWQAYDADGPAIFAQHFDATGGPQGAVRV